MYASALIPNFELQCALRAEPELGSSPVAILRQVAGATAPVIWQHNAAARREGVGVDMSVPQAQARCAQLVFRYQHERQEEIATAALLQASERATPYLENTFPGCCTLDLRRQGKLDYATWAHHLVEELRGLHLHARVGIAPTPDAALQTAQLARPVLVTDDSLQSMSQLPIMVLDPSDAMLDVLSDWGIQRVADLRALDRPQVAERLGLEGLALWDRAGGGDLRPLRLVRAAETYEEAAEFEGGVETLEPVLFRLRRALEQLTRRMRADLMLAGSIVLALEMEDRTVVKRTMHIPAPTCEADVLFRVMSTHLEKFRADSRVDGFRLRAFPSTPRDHQAHLWEASLRDPNGFSETLARLGGIVGAERVGTPKRQETHRPNCFDLESPDFEHNKTRSKIKAPSFLPLGLALRRYRPPRTIIVASKGDQPVSLQGSALNGRIRACAGPWRLDGNWWDEQGAWCWEEWDVELDAGGLYRLATHRQQRWWLLGLYD